MAIAAGVVVEAAPAAARHVDLGGSVLLPGMVNAHDHLDFSTFPALGAPPYASVYDWARDVDAGRDDPRVAAALAFPLVDRLFLGGLRNLLCGVTSVAHHNPYHRSLGGGFPIGVLSRYQFAHSPGLTPHLRRTYRTTDRRIPWMVHAAEGTDERCRGEIAMLAREGLLRQNAVIIHAIALAPGDVERIGAARAAAVWCPESNRRLYGATMDVLALRAAGISVGLGSDSPVSGVRDPLSNLAAAAAERVLGPAELLGLATRGSAEAARLAAGGAAPGDAADLVAVSSLDALLGGERGAVHLVVRAGRRVYGRCELMAGEPAGRLEVDGELRALAEPFARRAAAVLRRNRPPAGVAWLEGVRIRGGLDGGSAGRA